MTKILLLYDDITPALAKEFVGQMAKLAATEAVTVAVNSAGGSVSAGDAIALAIDRHLGSTTCRIDGIAASAASFICMFADRVIMSPGSFLMAHLPYATMVGTADDLTNAAGTLKEIERRYVATYAVRTGLSGAEVRKMLVAETWLSAARAVELNFADEIDTSLVTAKAVSRAVLEFRNVPLEVKAMAGGRKSFDDLAARRQRLKRRMLIIANDARFSRDTVRDREDRERGARMRKRQEMQALVDRGRAEAALRDAEERSEARRRLEADYFYDHGNIPRGQRRYE